MRNSIVIFYSCIRTIQIVFILNILIILSAGAQVSVGYLEPTGSRLSVDDLLRFSLVNATTEKQNVYARIIVTDQSGTKVLEGICNQIILDAGSNKVPSNLTFTRIEYNNTRYREYIYNNRKELPSGTYTISIIIYKTGTEEEISRGEFDKESEFMNPPILVTPFDGEELEVLQPMFSWLPPTPVSPGLKVTYKIKIVELLANQNINDAIAHSPLYLEKAAIPSLLLNYPPEARAFDFSKHFAWQIEAYADGIFIGRTDIWQFKFKNKTPINSKSVDIVQSYAVMKKAKDQGYYMAINNLKFKFDEEYNGGLLNVTIYDVHHVVAWSNDGKLVKKLGLNKYQLDLIKLKEIASGEYYELEVVNDKNEKYSLNFRYIRKTQE